jgi:hypothetical protein
MGTRIGTDKSACVMQIPQFYSLTIHSGPRFEE